MRWRVVLMGLLCVLGASEAEAKGKGGGVRTPGNLGIGIGSGTLASGVSLKYMNGDTAFQGNIGIYGRGRDRYFGRSRNWLALGFDYLFEMNSLTGPGDVELAWSIGPGVGLALRDDLEDWDLSISGVIGLEILFNVVPIDLVLEYRPSIFINDERGRFRNERGVYIDIVEFGAHLRFFF
jgi:hypothetical protein